MRHCPPPMTTDCYALLFIHDLPTMKSKQAKTAELEAELLRLNQLVRERRSQLARLENCPNTDCECRRVWRQVVDKNLHDRWERSVRKCVAKLLKSSSQGSQLAGQRHPRVNALFALKSIGASSRSGIVLPIQHR